MKGFILLLTYTTRWDIAYLYYVGLANVGILGCCDKAPSLSQQTRTVMGKCVVNIDFIIIISFWVFDTERFCLPVIRIHPCLKYCSYLALMLKNNSFHSRDPSYLQLSAAPKYFLTSYLFRLILVVSVSFDKVRFCRFIEANWHPDVITESFSNRLQPFSCIPLLAKNFESSI